MPRTDRPLPVIHGVLLRLPVEEFFVEPVVNARGHIGIELGHWSQAKFGPHPRKHIDSRLTFAEVWAAALCLAATIHRTVPAGAPAQRVAGPLANQLLACPQQAAVRENNAEVSGHYFCRLARRRGRGEEASILEFGRASQADRPAINAGRGHADEDAADETGIMGLEDPVQASRSRSSMPEILLRPAPRRSRFSDAYGRPSQWLCW